MDRVSSNADLSLGFIKPTVKSKSPKVRVTTCLALDLLSLMKCEVFIHIDIFFTDSSQILYFFFTLFKDLHF